MSKESKDTLREYFKKLKPTSSPSILAFENYQSSLQEKIINTFSIQHIHIKKWNLPFKKREFINSIASFYYKSHVGRRVDLLIYYDNILLGYIQYSSPILNRQIHSFLQEKYGKYDFNLLNDKVVELSICVPIGMLRKYLTGKLCVFCAMSKEIIDMYNKKYKTNIEVMFTTSIFGKSSMYNRVRNLKYLGLSAGYHSLLTKEQVDYIKTLYKKEFPHRKIKKTALSYRLVRLYDHLIKSGIQLPFEIKKLPKGVYVCDSFLPLKDNLNYWYNRWFIPRRKRIQENKI